MLGSELENSFRFKLKLVYFLKTAHSTYLSCDVEESMINSLILHDLSVD